MLWAEIRARHGTFVGTSLILRQDGRLLYGCRSWNCRP